MCDSTSQFVSRLFVGMLVVVTLHVGATRATRPNCGCSWAVWSLNLIRVS
jgi:hypothetical protein